MRAAPTLLLATEELTDVHCHVICGRRLAFTPTMRRLQPLLSWSNASRPDMATGVGYDKGVLGAVARPQCARQEPSKTGFSIKRYCFLLLLLGPLLFADDQAKKVQRL